jgi:hypothetical protein
MLRQSPASVMTDIVVVAIGLADGWKRVGEVARAIAR